MKETAPDGLIIVDKPSGWTSHDVVAQGRRLARTRKVGHAGTLDPMATGVLLLGVGRATRLLGHLALEAKGYDATIRLGQSTVTDDAEGEILRTVDASRVDDDDVERAAKSFRGDIQQVPSSVSAIKVDGERAYKRVRAGEELALRPRPVHVTEFRIGNTLRMGSFLDVHVHVECSTGTYVRALARDLGAVLEVGGHLTALRRTRVAGFTLDQARTLEELERQPLDALVLPLADVATASFDTDVVDPDQLSAVRNGRALERTVGTSGRVVAVMSPDGEFLALYEQRGALAVPVAVFAPPATDSSD